jgi:hypothetical protein
MAAREAKKHEQPHGIVHRNGHRCWRWDAVRQPQSRAKETACFSRSNPIAAAE